MELLVALGIAAVIAGAIAGAIITLMRLSPPSQEYIIAYRNMQNAGYWFTMDTNMASKVERPTGEPSTIIKLTQPRWDAGQKKSVDTTVTYKLENGKLYREEYNSLGQMVHRMTVAENTTLEVYLKNDTSIPECCLKESSSGGLNSVCARVTCEVREARGRTDEVSRCYLATPRVQQ